MVQLSVLCVIVVASSQGFTANTNVGDLSRFLVDHEMTKKIVELEHDHEVMKYLLAKYQQLEDTNIETAKILESQESVIKSLQLTIREMGTELETQYAAIKYNEEVFQEANETLTKVHYKDVRELKDKTAEIAVDITELREKSKLNSDSSQKLQSDVKAHDDAISRLEDASRTCSRDITNLEVEVKDQKEDIEELETKYLNLTADNGNKFRDCREILAKDKFAASGVYRIEPSYSLHTLQVYCDMGTQDGGWIVFMRRKDGSEDFNRNWSDYSKGFGDLNGEFWLGLDNIHNLVSEGKWELLVNMKNSSTGSKYALYEEFNVGSESSGYVLSVGNYTGDVRDSLAYNSGMKFTTKDRDNDLNPGGNCAAASYKGAWWYKARSHSLLTFVYGRIKWSGFSGYIDFVEMKMRRVN